LIKKEDIWGNEVMSKDNQEIWKLVEVSLTWFIWLVVFYCKEFASMRNIEWN
jgi:hypothetical protein